MISRLIRTRTRSALAASLISGLGISGASFTTLADDTLPAPVQALTDQGIEIHQRFEAPGGLTGFGASAQGQEMAVYLTPDGKHVVVGTLMDGNGNNLTEPQLDKHVRAPLEAKTWALLEDSHWIQDGDKNAPRIIYTFTDPNCPYCQQLWEAARPWVDAGRVQLRHIMVGILAADSPAKAATMLAADNPAATLNAQKQGKTITPSAQPRKYEEQVYANNQLFESLGLYATPTSAYQRNTDDGSVRIERVQGMPNKADLIKMMGSEMP
ncbi:MAG: thiol:disulfide interchange protein DsbG [Halomonas sp.]|nr:thiol:disulfide interchange protein DsbG [Halomonas sp.]MDN6315705.1 thiol:disulfide interchange protein DsbG [Halomonas sp.]MDN6336423.1 thiol:disulfide interchange protein DsbG [Halomonas sp.]